MDNKEKLFSITQKTALLQKLAEDGLFQARLLDELIVEASQLPDMRPLLDMLYTFRKIMIERGYYP